MKAGRKDAPVDDDAREDFADLDVADQRSRLGRTQQVRRAAEQRPSGSSGKRCSPNHTEKQLPLAGAHRALEGADILSRATETLHTDGQHANRGM